MLIWNQVNLLDHHFNLMFANGSDLIFHNKEIQLLVYFLLYLIVSCTSIENVTCESMPFVKSKTCGEHLVKNLLSTNSYCILILFISTGRFLSLSHDFVTYFVYVFGISLCPLLVL